MLKLSCTAEDMRPLAAAAGFKKGVHKWKEADRAELKAQLDAAYFHLYGFSRDEVEYILSTFSGTDRPEPTQLGAQSVGELIVTQFEALQELSSS